MHIRKAPAFVPFVPSGFAQAAICCVMAICAAWLTGCAETSLLSPHADTGPTPTLVTPRSSLLPTVNIAPAIGWPAGRTPTAAAGTSVRAFAIGLDHPRWLTVLPNGDVLVAESNAPSRPDNATGVKGWVMSLLQARAGAGSRSADRITLLRDADGDGQAEFQSVFLEGLHSPFGMALVGTHLYVANTDGVVEYPYVTGQTRIDVPARTLAILPAGPLNHHWTKSLIASADGSKLYATVGSNSNAAENGLAVEEGRASIWEIDRASGDARIYATGLRNPNGMAWSSDGKLWVVVNERDELGSDLVPDYLTAVNEGGFYGWPYSWYGSHADPRVSPQQPDLVARALVPDYALGAHVAALGLTASGPAKWPRAWNPVSDAGVFIGLHGSWNRRPSSGYKVVYVGFSNGRPVGLPVDVLTGFVDARGQAMGRPVGVVVDQRAGLLVADDVGNVVWRVTPLP